MNRHRLQVNTSRDLKPVKPVSMEWRDMVVPMTGKDKESIVREVLRLLGRPSFV